MIEALGWTARAALQATAATDTVLVRQVGSAPSAFETITNIASALLTVSVLVLAIALIFAAFRLRKSFQKVSGLLDRIYGDMKPIVQHATAVADNIDYISTAVRSDVQQINATITTANRRLQAAVAQTESRLREFNALLGVVQEEAEHAFVSAASTVRGVRSGAAALRDDGGMDLAMDEEEWEDEEELEDDGDELDAGSVEAELEDEELTDLEEGVDGYDGESEPAARPTARPRLRPRSRRRG